MQIGRQAVSRLSAVKAVVGDFLERRVGDRLGLLLFGQRAYLVNAADHGSRRGEGAAAGQPGRHRRS